VEWDWTLVTLKQGAGLFVARWRLARVGIDAPRRTPYGRKIAIPSTTEWLLLRGLSLARQTLRLGDQATRAFPATYEVNVIEPMQSSRKHPKAA